MALISAPHEGYKNALFLRTYAHQRTSIPGIYAAGDVVHALNQMSVAVAHAATAATAIHNSLPYNYR